MPWARNLIGVRTFRPGLALGRADGTALDDVGVLARVVLDDVEGVIVAVPWLPHQLLGDQQGALRAMERAVQIAAPVQFVGLGSVLAVIAGRGAALQDACGIPVTTGNAATAWCAAEVTREVAGGRPVAVLGGRGAVGRAIADVLASDGVAVTLDPADAHGFPVVVGASTTGGVLPPSALDPDATLVDVALPPTLSGRPPRGLTVLAGESLALPPGWGRDVWGHLFHVLAGYGWSSVYACLVEPLVALRSGRSTPFAQGRRVGVEDVRAFGAAARAAGFVPEARRMRAGYGPP